MRCANILLFVVMLSPISVFSEQKIFFQTTVNPWYFGYLKDKGLSLLWPEFGYSNFFSKNGFEVRIGTYINNKMGAFQAGYTTREYVIPILYQRKIGSSFCIGAGMELSYWKGGSDNKTILAPLPILDANYLYKIGNKLEIGVVSHSVLDFGCSIVEAFKPTLGIAIHCDL